MLLLLLIAKHLVEEAKLRGGCPGKYTQQGQKRLERLHLKLEPVDIECDSVLGRNSNCAR